MLCELGDPVHVLEADRAANPGPNTATTGRAGSRRWTRSSIVSNCAAPGELDREPRAQARVGLDDGDVVAPPSPGGASTVA